ncbi:MAG TPA: dihydroneopterin aldolase [Candidatus Latescibacteria bacterium]|nr:dihydroneopterin aldolase [Candidatus Latescibacterota bacterium]
MAQDVLRLKGMRFHAYHGVLQEEKGSGQVFEVDLEMAVDLQRPAQTDRLEDTIDYAQLFELIKGIVTGERYNLIETLADRIAMRVRKDFKVPKITVRVRKLSPPLDGELDHVEVEIRRRD